MTKEELIQLAKDSIGTNFGYEDLSEEELKNDFTYQAKIKVARLSPKDRKFIENYQQKLVKEKYSIKNVIKMLFKS